MEEQKTPNTNPIVSPPQQQTPLQEQPPKKKRGVLLYIIIGVVLLLVGLAGYMFLFGNKTTQSLDLTKTDLHTYFTYTNDELKAISNLDKPEQVTTTQDIYHWEEEAYSIVAKNKTGDPSRLYAYLTVSQRDALLITRGLYGEFRGDTSAISKKVLCEFYPEDCQGINVLQTDAFSEKLADIIIQKVKQRVVEDAATTKDYPLKDDPKYWNLTPQIGRDAGSYKPWFIEKGDQFRVPENPEFAVQNYTSQLAQVKEAHSKITPDQRKAVIFWAGGPGTKTPPGIWLDISGEYMLKKQTPVEKYLDTQTLLAAAITDSLIGCFDSKYTYLVKRPYLVDPTIKTVMPTPNHPSYPAGHACVSNAAATVLTAQLDENQDEWERLATEASNSRVWGGIHYPVDNEQGTILGKQVGEFSITRFNQL